MLLNHFSEANVRLAQDNHRLREGRQMLATDHAVVLDEIDYLRGRLNRLEGSATVGNLAQADAISKADRTAAASSLLQSALASTPASVSPSVPTSTHGYDTMTRGFMHDYGPLHQASGLNTGSDECPIRLPGSRELHLARCT
jgi:hypothetical protein